jgi:diguanylate cyclase (GGDEF)-like protein
VLPATVDISLMLVLLASTAVAAATGGFAVQIALRRMQARVDAARLEARRDALTGLPNRRAFEEALADAAPGTALVLADVDGFKAVNWAGHQAGDALLARFAASLPSDLAVARWGGDEFAALVPASQARAAAEAMRAAARAASDGATTLSIGIAHAAPLFTRADRALLRAKARGGDQVVLDNVLRLVDPMAAAR